VTLYDITDIIPRTMANRDIFVECGTQTFPIKSLKIDTTQPQSIVLATTNGNQKWFFPFMSVSDAHPLTNPFTHQVTMPLWLSVVITLIAGMAGAAVSLWMR
jgi:hypothetical protein